jgi:hypothetical protein
MHEKGGQILHFSIENHRKKAAKPKDLSEGLVVHLSVIHLVRAKHPHFSAANHSKNDQTSRKIQAKSEPSPSKVLAKIEILSQKVSQSELKESL